MVGTTVSEALTPSLAVRVVTCGASILVAESLFKFHSFTLECLAFLALWGALNWIGQLLVKPKDVR